MIMDRLCIKSPLFYIGHFLLIQAFWVSPPTFGQSSFLNTLTEASNSEKNLSHPITLQERLERVGTPIEENDQLFGQVINVLNQIREQVKIDDPIANETVLVLQQAGYGSSVISTEVSLFRTVLDDKFFGALPAFQPMGINKIQQFLLPFEKSKMEFQRAIHSLREEILKFQALVPSIKSGDFSSLHSTSDSYLQNQQKFLEHLKDLKSTVLSFGVRAVTPEIRDTVFEFLDKDKPEDKNFGLFTYVLFVAPNVRNAAFFEALAESTPIGGRYKAQTKPYLHIFYVPVHNRIQATNYIENQPPDSPALGSIRGHHSYYDFPFSSDLRVRYCASPTNLNTARCPRSGQGPYLLTTTQPLSRLDTVPSPTLLLDLSNVHEKAFGEFIRGIKEQVMSPDFTDRRKVETLRLRLLSVILTAADVVVPIKKGVESILHLTSLHEGSMPSKSGP
jgi:hypothetical protein